MAKRETVYLLGAGVNQCIVDLDGLTPPLSKSFFQTALKSPRYALQKQDPVLLGDVYDYIGKYWHLSEDDLRSRPFDLEDCFTLLQLQIDEASEAGNVARAQELRSIYVHLVAFLAQVLQQFWPDPRPSSAMQAFGERLLADKPTVITFNWDCILEQAIESASGVRSQGQIPRFYLNSPAKTGAVPFEELAYSHFNWNRPLAYGVRFREVQLQRAGLSSFVEGEAFYNHPDNSLYDWKLLKLHGSLNWFVYWQPIHPSLGGSAPKSGPVLSNSTWWGAMPPLKNAWWMSPLLITPVLYKYYQQEPFPELWYQAKLRLESCSHLIVIGYSLPPTDFAVRRLLLEAFSENDLAELTIVNPDPSVVRLFKELTHFHRPVRLCHDLSEFLGKSWWTDSTSSLCHKKPTQPIESQ